MERKDAETEPELARMSIGLCINGVGRQISSWGAGSVEQSVVGTEAEAGQEVIRLF